MWELRKQTSYAPKKTKVEQPGEEETHLRFLRCFLVWENPDIAFN